MTSSLAQFALNHSLLASVLHPEPESLVTPSTWLRSWSWEPGIVIPVSLMAALYAVGSWRIYHRNSQRPAIRLWEVISFWLGWLSLVLALDSPLHKLGEVLFSAHMTQHEVLMVVAAPLIVFSKPLIASLFALPERWRVWLGASVKSPAFSSAWQRLTASLTVWILHGVAIWTWHIPFLYQATLDDEFVHAIQHICFFGTALLFWWTLTHGRYGRFGYGVAFVYVFTTALHTSILGALMTFTQRVWYPLYAGRTAPWGLTPLEDQQLGGLIMWIPSGVVFLVIGLAIFAAWLGESERRQKYSRLHQIGGQHAD